jgi:GTPase SAR1 family protein
MNFKIVIYGDKKSGKTSFINKLLYNRFTYKYSPTKDISIINTNYFFKDDKSSNNTSNININLFECPENSILKDMLCIDANAVILIYDITNKKSFYNLYNYYKNMKNINSNIPILILANKNDSLKEHYDYRNLIRPLYSYEYSLFDNIKFYNISCKNKIDKNINISFHYLLSKLIN